MAKIAIDIALFPSEEMMNKAIEFNKELLKNNINKIELNKENCLPHITLFMGIVEEDDLDNIKERLLKIVKDYSPFNLIIDHIDIDQQQDGNLVSVLGIKKNKEIQSLHKKIMKEFSEYLTENVTKEMFLTPPEIDEETTVFWVKNYGKKLNDPDSYSPHITIGVGKLDIDLPIEFSANTIAVCHFGNYCTCRKVLALIEL